MLLSEKDGQIVTVNDVVQDEAELEKRFNNAEGMVYYYTTGDNTVDYVDIHDNIGDPTNVIEEGKYYRITTVGNTDFAPFGAPANSVGITFTATSSGTLTGTGKVSNTRISSTNPIMVNVAPAFSIDMKRVGNNNNAGTMQALTRSGGKNIAFGGVVNAEGGTNQGGTSDTPVGNVHRGFYLFSDSDSMEALRIPFPQIGNPRVANIQLVYALFDDYHLLSAFEADGSTPKITKKSDVTVGNADKVKNIFAEKHLNFSQASDPLVRNEAITGGVTFGVGEDAPSVPQSIYLTESSVQSSQSIAGGYRAWGEVFLDILRLESPSWSASQSTDSGGPQLQNIVKWDINGALIDTPTQIPLTNAGISTVFHECNANITVHTLYKNHDYRALIFTTAIEGFSEDFAPERTSIHLLPEIGVMSTAGLPYASTNLSQNEAKWMPLQTWASDSLTQILGQAPDALPRERRSVDGCFISKHTSNKIEIITFRMWSDNIPHGELYMPNAYRIKFGILASDQ
jgi:hypothetical protein